MGSQIRSLRILAHPTGLKTRRGQRANIRSGRRTSSSAARHLHVAFYCRCNTRSDVCPAPTSAVAYRQPPEKKVFINALTSVARSGFDPYGLAGTLAHVGIGHLLGGYGHSFKWTPDRDFSVPYSISGASHANDDAFQHCRKALGYQTAKLRGPFTPNSAASIGSCQVPECGSITPRNRNTENLFLVRRQAQDKLG